MKQNGTDPTEPSWQPLVEQLASLPITITNLLTDHNRRPDGMCAECTTAGTGLHQTPYPCSLQQVAESARQHAEQIVDDADFCHRCPHPAEEHNADGCVDADCACEQTWVGIEIRRGLR